MTPLVASIIIPVYNRTPDLVHVLEQLREQGRQEFEVVVVDDGSDPPVSHVVSADAFPFPCRIERHDHRSGIGRARNTGVRAARAAVVVFVDSDGDIFDNQWFEKHLALHEKAGQLARNAGKECYLFHSEVRGISHTYWGLVDTYSNWFGSSMKHPCEIRDRHVPTHNTSVQKAVFDLVGPFDEELEVCEDVEWAFRCLDNGVGQFFIPGAPVGHFDRNGFRDMLRHYYRFGLYAIPVRNKRKQSAYRWLFPTGLVSAAVLFLPLTALMTAYITLIWFRKRPQVLLYVPGLYLANVAFYAGIFKYLLDDRR